MANPVYHGPGSGYHPKPSGPLSDHLRPYVIRPLATNMYKELIHEFAESRLARIEKAVSAGAPCPDVVVRSIENAQDVRAMMEGAYAEFKAGTDRARVLAMLKGELPIPAVVQAKAAAAAALPPQGLLVVTGHRRLFDPIPLLEPEPDPCFAPHLHKRVVSAPARLSAATLAWARVAGHETVEAWHMDTVFQTIKAKTADAARWLLTPDEYALCAGRGRSDIVVPLRFVRALQSKKLPEADRRHLCVCWVEPTEVVQGCVALVTCGHFDILRRLAKLQFMGATVAFRDMNLHETRIAGTTCAECHGALVPALTMLHAAALPPADAWACRAVLDPSVDVPDDTEGAPVSEHALTEPCHVTATLDTGAIMVTDGGAVTLSVAPAAQVELVAPGAVSAGPHAWTTDDGSWMQVVVGPVEVTLSAGVAAPRSVRVWAARPVPLLPVAPAPADDAMDIDAGNNTCGWTGNDGTVCNQPARNKRRRRGAALWYCDAHACPDCKSDDRSTWQMCAPGRGQCWNCKKLPPAKRLRADGGA